MAGSGRRCGVRGPGPGAGSGGRMRAGSPVLVAAASASPAGAAVHGVDGAAARVRVAGGAVAAAGAGFHRGRGRGPAAAVPAPVRDLRRGVPRACPGLPGSVPRRLPVAVRRPPREAGEGGGRDVLRRRGGAGGGVAVLGGGRLAPACAVGDGRAVRPAAGSGGPAGPAGLSAAGRVGGAGRVRGPGCGDAAAGGRPRACAAPALAPAPGDRLVTPDRRHVAGLAGRRERLMTDQAGLLDLSAGSALLLAGTEWTVASVEAQHGRVLLSSGGEDRWRSIRWLVHHPDCQPVAGDAAEPARPAGQPPVLDDLTDYQREVVRLRVAHLLEAETGFRSGDPLQPGPGEPRPVYDPRATTLGQRRRAKAAELKALGTGEAALLGLGQVSERTLERMAAAWKDRGPAGCID